MKKERLMNLVGIMFFYLVLVLGVIAINARMDTINNGTSAIFYNK